MIRIGLIFTYSVYKGSVAFCDAPPPSWTRRWA